jgi:hypothetical protein
MLRAAFWLLAAVILTELFSTMLAAVGCVWLIAIARTEPLGACMRIGEFVNQVWAEALAAILALLLASKNGIGPPPPPPPPPPAPDASKEGE